MANNVSKTDPVARFWLKVEKQVGEDGCFLWRGTLNRDGYGQFFNGTTNVLAHRFGYEHQVGPIPDGEELDHLCPNRHCVRGSHLESVTHAVNMERQKAKKTICANGHPLHGPNLRMAMRAGYVMRECRACCAAREKARRARIKAHARQEHQAA